jgi:hypothetical protein
MCSRVLRYIFLITVLLFTSFNYSGRISTNTIEKTATSPATGELQRENALTVVYPQNTTELVGGQSFRITVFLTDFDEQPIEGALIEAKLWTPDGALYAPLPCFDKSGRRYLADPVSLPLRNSQGNWKITTQATWEDDESAEGEGHFTSLVSYSERLQDLFDFWIDLTDLFPYNKTNAADPRLKTYPYEKGGFVIFANNLTLGEINTIFVILNVHWQDAKFPNDEAAAVNYVLDLAGPHQITLDIPTSSLEAEKTKFQGWLA